MLPEHVHPLAYLVKRYGLILLYILLAVAFYFIFRKAGAKVFLISLAGFILLVLALAYWGQKVVIFFPFQQVEATPEKHQLSYRELRLSTSDGERIHGWFIPGEREAPVVLFCHGNASTMSHSAHLRLLQMLNSMGVSAVIFDYRGFGQSTGSPEEEGTYRDAEAVWDYLRHTRGFEPGEIVIWGKSLGGGIASHLASRHPECRGLILECPFTSIPDLTRRMAPFLPAEWIIRHEYPVKRYVQKLGCPLLLMHSPEDETVPYALGREVFSAAPEPKRFLKLSGSHLWGFWASRQDFVPAVREFLLDPESGGKAEKSSG